MGPDRRGQGSTVLSLAAILGRRGAAFYLHVNW